MLYIGARRAVDEHGQVLDILMQKYRDTKAAKKFFQKIIRKVGFAPSVVITDKLKSYQAGMRKLGIKPNRRQHKALSQPSRTFPSMDSVAREENATV